MPKTYLYGLQRSGTNALVNFLKLNYDITLSNSGGRNSISHKHCRIYDNKNFIPSPEEYSNTFLINSIQDMDKLLDNNENSNKYIVIYKDIFSWLPSISEWAKKCNWKNSDKMDFIDDYLNFIDKWNTIKNERVLLISYNEYLDLVVNTNNNVIKKLEDFLEIKNEKELVIPTKVPQSKEFTVNKINYYKNKEYMDFYTENELKMIQSHDLYLKLLHKNFIK
jgi:hypothetical protein